MGKWLYRIIMDKAVEKESKRILQRAKRQRQSVDLHNALSTQPDKLPWTSGKLKKYWFYKYSVCFIDLARKGRFLVVTF